MLRSKWVLTLVATCMLQILPIESKAILGIDLGSLYMKVALVQRGAPLEIVTNLHSKRKTENMILFDAGTRFYGADASSLLARKPQKTPVSMSIMLGRDDEHPAVKVLEKRHFPIVPKYNESRYGSYVTIEGEDYTPEELVAMLLHHAKDIAQVYAGEQGAVGSAAAAARDCVLTVPSFATAHERRALLDAASLADLNVLGLIEENTASALHFAMDKLYEDAQILLFYNLGASSLQVTIVKIHSYSMKGGGTSTSKTKEQTVGSIEVLGKAWDSTLGGKEFDDRVVEYLADTFNEAWDKKRGDGQKKDVRVNARAMTKLRIQANKVKHVLSANSEIPIYMESLYDDTALSTQMTRAKLEELCHDLTERAVTPVHTALKMANLTLDDITGIELIGGGMRIPKVRAELSKALNGMELGMHINSDESMALGASFHGANVSTAFRVRHVGLTDVTPFSIAISLEDLIADEKAGFFGGKKKKDSDDEEKWSKHATIFKKLGKMGVKKTIAFTHDKDVQCALDYEESDMLPEGTEKGIGRYNITGVNEFAKEMEEKGLGKPKLSLQFELSTSGLTRLVKAEAAVEEMYTVEEEVEVDDENQESENDTNATTEEKSDDKAESETKEDDDKKEKSSSEDNSTEAEDEESKKAEKKKKTIKVQKEKKRVHRRPLVVKSYNVGRIQPYSEELVEESTAKLAALAKKDMERVQLEEARNKVESYVYFIRNKLLDDEEAIGKVSTEEQREAVSKFAEETEEWMYDEGATADLATLEERYLAMSEPAEKMFTRVTESHARPEAILALQEKLIKVEELMKKWETTHPQVTEEERSEVLSKVETIKTWITEKEAEQAKKEAHEDPAFFSKDVPVQTKSLEGLVKRLSRKPKPKVKKSENATSTDNTTTANSTNTDEDEAKADEKEEDSKEDSKSEEKSESESKQDSKTDDEL